MHIMLKGSSFACMETRLIHCAHIYWHHTYRIWDVEVQTEDLKAFNKAMSSLCISVEWLFGDVSHSFKFIDFKKNLKLRLSAIAKFYVVAALIRNILTCLYGNTTSKYVWVALQFKKHVIFIYRQVFGQTILMLSIYHLKFSLYRLQVVILLKYLLNVSVAETWLLFMQGRGGG